MGFTRRRSLKAMPVEKPTSILIIVPEADRRGRISVAFRRDGYEVVEAPDARSALHHLMSEHVAAPSAILLAMDTPGMSGAEFLDIIKNYYRLSLVPVVTFSDGGAPGSTSPKAALNLMDPDEEQLRTAMRRVLRDAAERS